MSRVSSRKLPTRWEVEEEDVEFLTSPEGGSLTMEAVAQRLGVSHDGLLKRTERRRRLARQRG